MIFPQFHPEYDPEKQISSPTDSTEMYALSVPPGEAL